MWEDIASQCNQEDSDKNRDVNQTDLNSAQKVTAFIKEEKETIQKLKGYNQYASWLRFQATIKKQRQVNLFKEVLKYAAIVVFVFLSGYLISELNTKRSFSNSQLTTIEIPNTEKGKVTLADGTEVILNSGTSLKYADDFTNSREVFLSGEAKFHVKSDKQNPFLVHLDDISIKVTGTTFNIRSYAGSVSETTLLEGVVSILDDSGNELLQLAPNEQAVYNHTEHRIEHTKVKAVDYAAWDNGKVFLKDKTLGELSIYLKKWYDVCFAFEEERIKDIRVTGTILTHKPLEQILEVLQLSDPLNFDVKELDGQKNISVRYRR